WTIRAKPGTHKGLTSIPLGFVVRDMLNLTKTAKETKHILNKGMVHVDGMVRKEHQFPLGLFDSVSIPTTKKNYRLMLDTKGRLKLHEISDAQLKQKPVKVVHKRIGKGKVLTIQTHDGKTFRGAQNAVHVDDSVMVPMKGNTIEGHMPLQSGSRVYITGGKHVGEVAQIAGIVEGTMKRNKLVNLTEGKEKFQTTIQNVMVINDDVANWIKTAHAGGKTA
ncbi:MAG: hypothetical protein AABX02_03615, partial [archaeon]